ncbi:hypothetical protein D3C87_1971510 [compost metagenome]
MECRLLPSCFEILTHQLAKQSDNMSNLLLALQQRIHPYGFQRIEQEMRIDLAGHHFQHNFLLGNLKRIIVFGLLHDLVH